MALLLETSDNSVIFIIPTQMEYLLSLNLPMFLWFICFCPLHPHIVGCFSYQVFQLELIFLLLFKIKRNMFDGPSSSSYPTHPRSIGFGHFFWNLVDKYHVGYRQGDKIMAWNLIGENHSGKILHINNNTPLSTTTKPLSQTFGFHCMNLLLPHATTMIIWT